MKQDATQTKTRPATQGNSGTHPIARAPYSEADIDAAIAFWRADGLLDAPAPTTRAEWLACLRVMRHALPVCQSALADWYETLAGEQNARPTYEKNWHWGAVGAYPLAMSPAEMKAAETELRRLVSAIAAKRGITGRRGSQARQGISRKLRSCGLRSPYALAIRAEIGEEAR